MLLVPIWDRERRLGARSNFNLNLTTLRQVFDNALGEVLIWRIART